MERFPGPHCSFSVCLLCFACLVAALLVFFVMTFVCILHFWFCQVKVVRAQCCVDDLKKKFGGGDGGQ